MWKRIRHSVIQPTQAAGVEIVFRKGNDFRANLAVLTKQKEQVELETYKSNIKEVEELSAWLSPAMPVYLILNGKGIMHKKVSIQDLDQEESARSANSIERVLPNAKPEDFYLQELPTTDEHRWLSLIRRERHRAIIQSFERNQWFVVANSLGPFVLKTIIPLLGSEQQISVNGYHLGFKGKQIDTFRQGKDKKEHTSIELAGEQVPEEIVVPFAGGLQLLHNVERSNILPVSAVRKFQSEWRYKQVFHYLGWGLLCFFFVVLLGNFILFSSLRSKHQALSQKVNQNKDKVLYLDQLEREVNTKKTFLSEAGWLRPSRTSFYADRIGKTIPGSIRLNKMIIYPPVENDRESKEESSFFFQPGIIRIAGITRESLGLNQWLKMLNAKSWVQRVKVLQYSEEDRKAGGQFLAQIRVK